MAQEEPVDLIIVGGGPTGLYAAFYAGLRGMRTRIVDSLDQLGGQLTALYPDKFIYDVAGFPAVLARTLVAELVRQAMQHSPQVALGERVRYLRRREAFVEVTTDSQQHSARTVLVAAGGGAFTPKRLPAPQCGEYEGRGLYYSVRDLSEFRGKRVLVVGGGNSAVDWALNIRRVTPSVTLIHRRDRFRAHEDSVAKLLASGAQVRTFQELANLNGQDRVESATLVDTRTGGLETVPVDAVLVNIGFTSTLGPMHDWGLVLDAEGVVVNTRMETNMPGVYAAGDIASYSGKLKLISVGFGEAATAVNHAKVFIEPASAAFPGHSTNIVPRLRKAAHDAARRAQIEPS